jgi:hypothetical protein
MAYGLCIEYYTGSTLKGYMLQSHDSPLLLVPSMSGSMLTDDDELPELMMPIDDGW